MKRRKTREGLQSIVDPSRYQGCLTFGEGNGGRTAS